MGYRWFLNGALGGTVVTTGWEELDEAVVVPSRTSLGSEEISYSLCGVGGRKTGRRVMLRRIKRSIVLHTSAVVSDNYSELRT